MNKLKLIWIGPRESEVLRIKDMFYKTITYYGSNKENNVSLNELNGVRLSNMYKKQIAFDFYLKEIKSLIYFDVYFMFYNPLLAYKIAKHIPNFISKCICLNKYDTLIFLNDKTKTRYWLKEHINVPEFKMVEGEHCNIEYLKRIFEKSEKFIVQENVSSGGNGTFLVDDNSNFIPNNSQIYLCTKYIENNISINIHIIVSSKQVIIESPSIQLIQKKNGRLIYFGADYIEAKRLECLDELNTSANKIATLLQKIGYRGVCGIDFVYSNKKLYFIELNPRFQASTFLLNDFRIDKGLKSIQELQINSFSNKPLQSGLYDTNESFYRIVHLGNDQFEKYIYERSKNCNYIKYIHTDNAFLSKKIEDDAYMYHIVFSTNICSINADGEIFIAENIKNHHLDNSFRFTNDLLKLKIALINQGVILSDIFIEYCEKSGGLRKGVFSAIDIIINDQIYINTPCNIKFTELSPFKIDIDKNNQPSLYYLDQKLINIKIYTKQILKKTKTKNGINFDRIAFIATDRVRIRHYYSCYYKDKNIGCSFCNAKKQIKEFKYEDITDTIDYYLNNVSFRHFLIGGGTGLPENETTVISNIAKYISSKSNKPIYVMSIPPKNLDVLEKYYKNGVSEVAFNIEIFNRDKAALIMPGKGNLSLNNYFDALQKSTVYFGKTGNVRSMIICGFDDIQTFLSGIEKLAQMGVAPIISVFRPMPNTVFENHIAPDNNYLYNIFIKSEEICKKYKLKLGPSCSACQNNTLSFPSNINRNIFFNA